MSISGPKTSGSSISEPPRHGAGRGRAAPRILHGIVAAVALLAASMAAAQAPLSDSTFVGPQPPQRIAGRVLRGTPAGQRPVAGVQVTLHRVGPDRAGPLDSSRTAADGSYTFTYRPSGNVDAVYFVSASYGGIAYFSEPTRTSAVGEAGAISVFDTTSGPVRIRVAGRHLVVSAPDPKGQREIAEVFDLSNDTSVTLVSGGGKSPVFTTFLPPGASGMRVNPAADIAPGAVEFHGDSVLLFAPLSPGIRQLSFVYSLPATSFPLSVPLLRATTVLEVLAEEPKMKVAGPALKEVAPVSADSRIFRRFLGEDIPSGTVLTVDAPPPEFPRGRYILALVLLFVLAMMAGLATAWHRRARGRSRIVAAPPAEPTSHQLLREIAQLDTRAERVPLADDERAQYAATRDALKTRLAAALAAERQPE